MFRRVPHRIPSRMDRGMDRIMARMTPGIPQICQSATRIRAISPAMAPRVMPKFSPMPAIMGISRQRIRKVFRPMRVTISFIR